jgi:hypothetical protein
MKKLFLIVLMVLLIVLSQFETKANKIMASDLTWICVGQDSILIKLVVYRDCNGDILSSTPISFNCAATGDLITIKSIGIGTPVDITPVCGISCTKCSSLSCSFPYGIHRYTLQAIVKLDGAGSCCGVKISWQQCCRNLSITTGAAGTDFYTEAYMNRCINPCDNSPSFTNSPVEILCVGLDYNLSQGVNDIDINSTGDQLLDSLNFEWSQPLSAVNTTVLYSGEYTYNKPIYFWGFPKDALNLPKGIHLDPQCGSIEFRPMKPDISVMVIKVNEFRNGVKIAELMRNIQIIVMTCPTNHPPGVTTQDSTRAKSVIAGETVRFDFISSDQDIDDSVNISWNYSIPGAIWTHTNGQSKHPTATLTWTPTEAHVRSLPYTFAVKVMDHFCPIWGRFTQVYEITVLPKLYSIKKGNQTSQSDFKIYPNPASENVNIVYNGLSKWEGRLLVFDPNSKLLAKRNVAFNKSNNAHQLPLNVYPSGMYLLKLENAEGTIMLKLLVQ